MHAMNCAFEQAPINKIYLIISIWNTSAIFKMYRHAEVKFEKLNINFQQSNYVQLYRKKMSSR